MSEQQREQFRQRVEELVAWFETNVDTGEWVTKRYPKKMRDEARAVYLVSALYLQKGPTRLLLDPVGYDMPGAEAAVDLYLMPTYDPLASLYFEAGQWMLYVVTLHDHSESSPAVEIQALPLSAETINSELKSIADHAVPSV